MERRSDRDWLDLWQALLDAEVSDSALDGVESAYALLSEALGSECYWHRDMSHPALEVEHGFGGGLVIGHMDGHRHGPGDGAPRLRMDGEWVRGASPEQASAGLITILLALDELPEAVPYRLVIISDQTHGGQESRDLAVSRSKQAPLALMVEPGGEDGAVVVARAGFVHYDLEISDHHGHEESSSVVELSRQVLWLNQLRQGTLDTTVEVVRMTAEASSSAHAEVQVRVWTEPELSRISEALAAPPVYDPALHVEYRGGLCLPPMLIGAQSNLWLARAGGVWRELTGKELVGVRSSKASTANYVAPWVVTLDGLGPWGHHEDQAVWWPSIQYRAKLLSRLLTLAAS